MANRDRSRDKIEKAALRATQRSLERVKNKAARRDSPEFKLGSLLIDGGLIEVEPSDKEDLLRTLAETVALGCGYPSAESILRSALEREATVNTYLGEGIAVPHARVPAFEGVRLVIARSRAGFPYDVETEAPVRLVLFLVGNEQETNMHVQVLAAIASVVKDAGVREEILSARSLSAARKILNAGAKGKRRRPRQLTKLLLSHSRKIARDIGATAVLVALEHAEELTILKRLPRRESFIVATRTARIAEAAEKVVGRVIRLPDIPLKGETLVRVGTLMGVAQGFISRDDVVAFLLGQAGDGLDTFSVLNVSREFGRFLTARGQFSRNLSPGLFERMLTLATELAREGREGKPLGTIFVIGDPEELAPHCQQLIINPFRGYPEDERNILDPTLHETIKEFATIDGAFIIDREGVLQSAGTYLLPGDVEVELASGLGTRHRAAAAITSVVNCISIVISESTGQITFFKKGEAILTSGPRES